MKRLMIAAGVAGALYAPLIASAPPANALPTAKAFGNCTALNATYRGGVATNSKVRNTKMSAGKIVRASSRYSPKVSASLYKSHQKLDRDKDGIACER